MRILQCAGLVLAFGISTVARADIVFDTGVDNTNTANVLFNDSATGSDIISGITVRGHIQGTPTADCASGALCVDVQSNETLVVNNAGGGQATIEADDGGFDLADIFLTVPPGGTYTKIVFALSGVGTGQSGTVGFDVTVTEGNGTTNTASFTTGSGNTFYTIVAINGQDIRNVNLTSTAGSFETLRQLRIGQGLQDPPNPPQGVPEPSSIALLGSLVVGTWALRKKFTEAH